MNDRLSLREPKTDDPLKLALRPREAAAAIGVSERTLWSWTKEGIVPHVKIGGRLLYPVAGLREWLSRRSGAAGGSGERARPQDLPATNSRT